MSGFRWPVAAQTFAALAGLGATLALPVAAAATPAAVPASRQLFASEKFRSIQALADKGDFAGALAATEALASMQADNSDAKAALLQVRVAILIELRRDSDVVIAVEQLLDRRIPVEAAQLTAMADAAARTSQSVKAAMALQAYAERFRDQVNSLRWEFVASILNDLRTTEGLGAAQSLALALFDAGYRCDNDFGGMGFVERQAIDGLVQGGRIAEAKTRLERLVDVRNLAGMAIDRRYEALWPMLESALGSRMAPAIARNLDWQKQAFARDPDSYLVRQSYVRELTWLGAPARAVALSEHVLTDPADIAASGRYGWWMVAAHADALGVSGDPQAGLRRYRQLNAAVPAASGVRIDTMIDEATFALRNGLSAEALTSAAAVKASDDVSAFGETYLLQVKACALHRLGRDPEALPIMAKIEADPLRNRGAALDAMLCVGHFEPAEALVLKILDDPVRRMDILLRLQGIEFQKNDKGLTGAMALLAARPGAAAAIATFGRRLPVSLRRLG